MPLSHPIMSRGFQTSPKPARCFCSSAFREPLGLVWHQPPHGHSRLPVLNKPVPLAVGQQTITAPSLTATVLNHWWPALGCGGITPGNNGAPRTGNRLCTEVRDRCQCFRHPDFENGANVTLRKGQWTWAASAALAKLASLLASLRVSKASLI